MSDILDSITSLHAKGFGARRIATALGLPLPEVLRLSDEAGVSLKRKGPVVGPDGPRVHRITFWLTQPEWADVVAAASDVGTVSPPEWAREAVIAAARGAR